MRIKPWKRISEAWPTETPRNRPNSPAAPCTLGSKALHTNLHVLTSVEGLKATGHRPCKPACDRSAPARHPPLTQTRARVVGAEIRGSRLG